MVKKRTALTESNLYYVGPYSAYASGWACRNGRMGAHTKLDMEGDMYPHRLCSSYV